jgi:hypothetical protein
LEPKNEENTDTSVKEPELPFDESNIAPEQKDEENTDTSEHLDAVEDVDVSEIHSEEVIRKNGVGKRSYHRITIR